MAKICILSLKKGMKGRNYFLLSIFFLASAICAPFLQDERNPTSEKSDGKGGGGDGEAPGQEEGNRH